jgi:nickel/cobalt transporter (NicO) family protein
MGMPDLAALIQHGSANLWLFVPSAVLLGALHGLEPGHSKTMMAAFIVAIRGTLGQAVLLGLSAAASHTAVVWVVALGGLYFGRNLNLATSEPFFQLASGAVVLGIAFWMLLRTRRDELAWLRAHAGDQPHAHHHRSHDHPRHDDHGHDHHDHEHDHVQGPAAGFQDAHELAHADDIRRRFAGREVTTGQIVLFGLTGGLIPCPASITVLLICLQLRQIAMGALLVLCFSLGLAVTMVAVGAAAALGLRRAEQRWGEALGAFARRAPYASSALIALVGAVMATQGLAALAR